jgi:hypothetical protein
MFVRDVPRHKIGRADCVLGSVAFARRVAANATITCLAAIAVVIVLRWIASRRRWARA